MEKKKHTALNTQLVLYLFLSAVFFLFFLGCIMTKEMIGAIFFFLIFLLAISVISISPIYVKFSEKGITAVYLWRQKEQISWNLIKYIEAGGNRVSKGALPYYRIVYPHVQTKPFFVNSEIPRTRRTKKLLHLYWKEKIRGEKRTRKK